MDTTWKKVVIKFEEKLEKSGCFREEEESILEIQVINSNGAGREHMEKIFEYLESQSIDVLRISPDTDDEMMWRFC